MEETMNDLRWKKYHLKSEELLLWGLKNDYINIYDEELIEKLRTIYYGGIPASILLLSNSMSNGYCYDRALLLSQAFLNEEDDINLIYATIDGIKLNPDKKNNNPYYAEHCFLERITKDNKHYIYDTSEGLVYDKEIYWKMENPQVRQIKTKKDILEFLESDSNYSIDNLDNDKYLTPLILPAIENAYNKPNELYSKLGILQREIELFKQLIKYNEICKKI